MRKFLLHIFFLVTVCGYSQTMSVGGSVQDTTGTTPLPYAVAMAIKLKDSTLVKFSRTDNNGLFKIEALPLDTYQVVITHSKFGEKNFIVLGTPKNNDFDFGKIIMLPKSNDLKEVVIYAFKDPIYFKGDTLVYTADSFKVKQNATVEDLLKKLPGIKVDAQGKITAQGKAVNQVLVDGDEFFGADPTVATKNLNADAIESVQVYEKKNEEATDGGDEMVKVMNLQLKDEAKKGYFGKASAASDFQKFYEGELLFNKFNNKVKFSFFSMASNTPKNRFNWGDQYKYAIEDGMNVTTNENGDRISYFSGNDNEGIPKTLKTGAYFTDKLSKNTKITLNYTYSPNTLESVGETRSQYFLTDTSYITKNKSISSQKNESHSANFSFEQKIDSLTDIVISPRFNVSNSSSDRTDINDFMTNSEFLTRRTTTTNSSKSTNYDISSAFRLNRKFKKKDRTLFVNYNFSLSSNETEGLLKSTDEFFDTSATTSFGNNIDQKKTSLSESQSHSASATYTEPLTKKIKLEFGYDFSYNKSIQDKKALNANAGEYISLDSTFTNNFENLRNTNRAGVKFIYEVKKQRLAFGARVRQIGISSENLLTKKKYSEVVNNILPYLTYFYKFSDNQRISFDYYTNSNPPSISQLQPVPDNTNPNSIRLGNPNLLPTFDHQFNVNYYLFKPLTDRNIWSYGYFTLTDNAFSTETSFDSIGRFVSKPINVDGNYNGGFNVDIDLPFFDKVFKVNPGFGSNISKSSSIVNSVKNVTKEYSLSFNSDFSLELEDGEFQISGSYEYNVPTSTLNNQTNKPYSTKDFSAEFNWEFPAKIIVESDATYTINDQRSEGYNINYLIWNASLSKAFLKNENLILGVEAKDLLNQNISTRRTVNDNVITDTKTTIIGRYIMLRLTYKFNSSKKKEEDNDW